MPQPEDIMTDENIFAMNRNDYGFYTSYHRNLNLYYLFSGGFFEPTDFPYYFSYWKFSNFSFIG